MNSGPAYLALGTANAGQPPQVMVAADGTCRTFGSGHTAAHAAAGLLAGIGLAQLLVPAITLTTDAAAPVPSALVIVPLVPAVALTLVTAAVPGAAAALSVLRRPDPAAQLRAEAG